MNPTEAAVTAAGGAELSGVLVVESDAKEEGASAPVLRVPLSGTANLAPRAVAVELITRQSEVKVGIGREVIIDGTDTEDPEGDPITFTWTLPEAPTDSEAILLGGVNGPGCTEDSECDEAQGYRCVPASNGNRCKQVAWTRVTPDLVGTYVVRLRATDDRGAWREADARILPRDFAVVLTWQTVGGSCLDPDSSECTDLSIADQRLYCCGQSDLDLHLLRPGGTAGDYGTCPGGCEVMTTPDGGVPTVENRCFEDGDTYADTCRQLGTDCAFANRYPEWGEVGRADDPRLDVDDVRGFGPEVITLNNPADGTYTAVVHYCTDRITEPSAATVQVYVEGELVHTAGPQLISGQDQAWIAGSLIRTGGVEDGTWSFVSVPDLFDDVAGPTLCSGP
jgi:hypothetical protein